MAYGFELGLFAGSGPITHAARDTAGRSSTRSYLAWRRLGREARLALVDRALNGAANDCDACPAAL